MGLIYAHCKDNELCFINYEEQQIILMYAEN